MTSVIVTRLVEQRAGGRCEYCRMHQALKGATFHVEHVIPTARGGSDEPENLAWHSRSGKNFGLFPPPERSDSGDIRDVTHLQP
jgi:hypothetical protein